MRKGSLRTALLGSTAAAMLIASAGTANALEYNFGSVQVFFDTTISAGVSMRTASTNNRYLPQSNGGPLSDTLDPFRAPVPGPAHVPGPVLIPGQTIPAGMPTNDTFVGTGATYGFNTWAPQIAGSINTDDGRLNFDRGDLTSGIVKMTNDIQVKWENYTFFSRINSYYDAVLDQNSSYARSNLVAGKADAARDIRLLDLYVAGNFDVGGLPLTVRAGKQVINWGEGTFILNGVNGAMPIDVNAFRRPGAEVKEGLLPIWAINASLGLPYNLSIEGFYQLQQAEYQLDRPGTPFSTSDVTSLGSGVGGNNNAVSFLTGGPGGNMFRNCSNPGFVNNAFNAAWAGSASAIAQFRDCGQNAVDFSQYNPTMASLGGWTAINGGSTEAFRLAMGDTSIIKRDPDRYAKDSGQYGIAARWYSEALNNTEFGFYFTNTHSRLPFASERISADPSLAEVSSYLGAGDTTGFQSRLLQYNGCNAAVGPAGVTSQPGAFYGVPLALDAGALDMLNQSVTDPDGIYAAGLAIANAFYAGAGGGPVVNAPAGSPFAGGIEGFNLAALAALNPNFALMANPVIQPNSVLALTIANCALVAEQSTSLGAGTPFVLVDGAEIMLATNPNTPGIGLYLEYPEDIRMYGFSFNTTLGTWGVQGDITYRPNQPVQLDTDQITINALHQGCIFPQLVGHTTSTAFGPLDTYGPGCGGLGTGAQAIDLQGYERTKIYTAQVGTTATFTNSNALIGTLGADLGILVTEVGAMYAPDAPKAYAETFTNANGQVYDVTTRWQNVCASGGTDLPLGGFLSLASRQGCRATSVSWGYVLLGQLQYNNVFGTAISLQPTIAWNHGVSGNSPAPLGNYRQGAKAVSLALNGNYLGNWRGGISYTNYMGNEKYVNNNDMDFVSANISYAF
ncbi:DUF1302 family protein [Parvibaculum sp.]|uniref:DUF1302 domain-containing protein n=1 Tax=Parvibaculum sp. TaxID=2024848 RepID=UPI001DDB4DBC|nr:DUF1302 family protein [Parvibaculum sp.]MBX3489645.1 DUF1302 domain-containing protein [Parvibaculum sp.]MCW5726397.1 DUF1302 domain-containing protein [Parvibaculum sp.]